MRTLTSSLCQTPIKSGIKVKVTQLQLRSLQYVEGCDACQWNKNHMQAPAGKLMPNSILEKP